MRSSRFIILVLSATSSSSDGTDDPFEMAAACLYHLARNPPFVDGNKRTALAAALVFLWLNGFRLVVEEYALTDLVVKVATGEVTKAEAAVFLKTHSKPC